MKKLVFILLSCFCGIDLFLLQKHFFVQCQWESMTSDSLHPVYCSDMAQFLQTMFGMAARMAIASIIGIVTLFSSKKGTIFVGSIAGLLALLWTMSEVYYLSIYTISSHVMRPMTGFERIAMILLQSPVPLFLLGAEVLGAMVWLVILSRKRLAKLF
jgi:hypothetical protein